MVERTQTLIVRSQKGFHSGVQSGAGYTFTRDRTAMQPESAVESSLVRQRHRCRRTEQVSGCSAWAGS